VQQPDLLQLYFLVALVMINRFSFQIQSDLFSGFPENKRKEVSMMMKELPFLMLFGTNYWFHRAGIFFIDRSHRLPCYRVS
jgi:hypothetical protein